MHTGVAVGIGLAFGLRDWRSLLALTVAASISDLDLIPRLFSADGMRFHHGPTHSLVGTVLLGLLVARVGRVPRWPCVLACVAHLPLDWSTGTPGAPAATFGIELWWPLSTTRHLDATPFFGAYGLHQEGFLLNMFAPGVLELYAREAGVAVGALATGWAIDTIRRRRAARS